jgi:hypothetical protein
MVIAESVFSDDLGDDRELERGDIASLEHGFSPLAIPSYPLWAVPGGTTRWSGGHDVILREDADIWLWARCRTVATVADLVRRSTPPTRPPISLRDELRVNSML